MNEQVFECSQQQKATDAKWMELTNKWKKSHKQMKNNSAQRPRQPRTTQTKDWINMAVAQICAHRTTPATKATKPKTQPEDRIIIDQKTKGGMIGQLCFVKVVMESLDKGGNVKGEVRSGEFCDI